MIKNAMFLVYDEDDNLIDTQYFNCSVVGALFAARQSLETRYPPESGYDIVMMADESLDMEETMDA